MGIDITKLTGKILEIAKIADIDDSKKIDGAYETSIFMTEADKAIHNGELTSDEVNEIFGLIKSNKVAPKHTSGENTDEGARQRYMALSRLDRQDVTEMTRKNTESEYLEMSHQLDTALLDKGVTGIELVANRYPIYDMEKLGKKYKDMQTSYNEAQNLLENWYVDPSKHKQTENKKLFEEWSEKILGMDFDKFAEVYAKELVAVSKVPPIVKGHSTLSSILLHDEAVMKLTEEERAVYQKLDDLNKNLYQEFRMWENNMKNESINKTYEVYSDIIDNYDVVEENEFAVEKGESSFLPEFKMPKNWIVKKNFINAINEKTGYDSIEDLESVKQKNSAVKVLDGHKVVIMKGNKKIADQNGIL